MDIFGDTPLFVDPRAIRLLPTEWGNECVTLLQNFFHTVILEIKNRQDEKAKRLLNGLHEPNETHLGMSRKKAKGRGMGGELSNDVWEMLSESRAAKSGLLTDLEDAALMVEGIDKDIISDIAINIIREPLIRFTQQVCNEYGITLEPGVDSGPIWDRSTNTWTSHLVSLPITDYGKLLLVPKSIVRYHLDYEREEYLRQYILTHLQGVELNAKTELVQLLKNGNVRVTKKSLRKKYGDKKTDIIKITKDYPEILEKYRKDKNINPNPPLDHEEINEITGIQNPGWDKLLNDVLKVPRGRENADNYHNAVERLLTPLFYPCLDFPEKEFKIHEGLKRIDIRYCNLCKEGFFQWVANHHPAMNIFVECKNISGDASNPELDQLAGRFGPSRGKVGLLLCRAFEDKMRFIQRCKNSANDQHGFIIVLDDQDLTNLVNMRKENNKDSIFNFLKLRFDELAM